jgi:hypothetical protein
MVIASNPIALSSERSERIEGRVLHVLRYAAPAARLLSTNGDL